MAKERFTMGELGAGYGRWLANAAAALGYLNGPPYKLIGVEAEPTHFRWLKEHMEDNRIDQSCCQLMQSAVDAKDGFVEFIVGSPSRWYGQSVWPPETMTNVPARLKLAIHTLLRKARLSSVRAISLNSILQPLERVDLIDLDVQGSELRVLSSAAEQLGRKVMRVHIGTHSPEIEFGLRRLFRGLGWRSKFDYPHGSESPTPLGNIGFQDGVQCWINARDLLTSERDTSRILSNERVTKS